MGYPRRPQLNEFITYNVKTIHFRLPVFLMNVSLKMGGFTIVFHGLMEGFSRLTSLGCRNCPLISWPAHLWAWPSPVVSNGAPVTSGKFMKRELPWDFPWKYNQSCSWFFPDKANLPSEGFILAKTCAHGVLWWPSPPSLRISNH